MGWSKHWPNQVIVQVAVSLLLTILTVVVVVAIRHRSVETLNPTSEASPTFWAKAILLLLVVCLVDLAWLIILGFWLARHYSIKRQGESAVHPKAALKETIKGVGKDE